MPLSPPLSKQRGKGNRGSGRERQHGSKEEKSWLHSVAQTGHFPMRQAKNLLISEAPAATRRINIAAKI